MRALLFIVAILLETSLLAAQKNTNSKDALRKPVFNQFSVLNSAVKKKSAAENAMSSFSFPTKNMGNLKGSSTNISPKVPVLTKPVALNSKVSKGTTAIKQSTKVKVLPVQKASQKIKPGTVVKPAIVKPAVVKSSKNPKPTKTKILPVQIASQKIKPSTVVKSPALKSMAKSNKNSNPAKTNISPVQKLKSNIVTKQSLEPSKLAKSTQPKSAAENAMNSFSFPGKKTENSKTSPKNISPKIPVITKPTALDPKNAKVSINVKPITELKSTKSKILSDKKSLQKIKPGTVVKPVIVKPAVVKSSKDSNPAKTKILPVQNSPQKIKPGTVVKSPALKPVAKSSKGANPIKTKILPVQNSPQKIKPGTVVKSPALKPVAKSSKDSNPAKTKVLPVQNVSQKIKPGMVVKPATVKPAVAKSSKGSNSTKTKVLPVQNSPQKIKPSTVVKSPALKSVAKSSKDSNPTKTNILPVQKLKSNIVTKQSLEPSKPPKSTQQKSAAQNAMNSFSFPGKKTDNSKTSPTNISSKIPVITKPAALDPKNAKVSINVKPITELKSTKSKILSDKKTLQKIKSGTVVKPATVKPAVVKSSKGANSIKTKILPVQNSPQKIKPGTVVKSPALKPVAKSSKDSNLAKTKVLPVQNVSQKIKPGTVVKPATVKPAVVKSIKDSNPTKTKVLPVQNSPQKIKPGTIVKSPALKSVAKSSKDSNPTKTNTSPVQKLKSNIVTKQSLEPSKPAKSTQQKSAAQNAMNSFSFPGKKTENSKTSPTNISPKIPVITKPAALDPKNAKVSINVKPITELKSTKSKILSDKKTLQKTKPGKIVKPVVKPIEKPVQVEPKSPKKSALQPSVKKNSVVENSRNAFVFPGKKKEEPKPDPEVIPPEKNEKDASKPKEDEVNPEKNENDNSKPKEDETSPEKNEIVDEKPAKNTDYWNDDDNTPLKLAFMKLSRKSGRIYTNPNGAKTYAPTLIHGNKVPARPVFKKIAVPVVNKIALMKAQTPARVSTQDILNYKLTHLHQNPCIRLDNPNIRKHLSDKTINRYLPFCAIRTPVPPRKGFRANFNFYPPYAFKNYNDFNMPDRERKHQEEYDRKHHRGHNDHKSAANIINEMLSGKSRGHSKDKPNFKVAVKVPEKVSKKVPAKVVRTPVKKAPARPVKVPVKVTRAPPKPVKAPVKKAPARPIKTPVKVTRAPPKAVKAPVQKASARPVKTPVKAPVKLVKVTRAPLKAVKTPVKVTRTPLKAVKAPVKKAPARPVKTPVKTPVKAPVKLVKVTRAPAKAVKAPAKRAPVKPAKVV